ncbi:uncharacterized protein BXZ73DRAFT_45873 [Epithele typhae]|uniref:uncharacterized protein n=1 Tax=Epithele typhae TaxID=378194 RepID=UPI0020074074|nr:uncharacterized protein BXZ73DRAFT_45873 [Epithele typhae]KAH9934019.1 hypothetical protein BXZ73DRAFT_45873 [Epithele typhae]
MSSRTPCTPVRPCLRRLHRIPEIEAHNLRPDPSCPALTGGNMSILPQLGGVMIRPVSLCEGVGHTFSARDETGRLVGFLCLTLPGQLILSTEEMRQCGMYEYLATLSPEGRRYFTETVAVRFSELTDEVLGIPEVQRKAYWCNAAMVREDWQGKGLGKAMFQLAFREAAKLGAAVALSTTNARNVAIYEKIGFECKGTRPMPSPWGDWNIWYFYRDSVSAEATPA